MAGFVGAALRLHDATPAAREGERCLPRRVCSPGAEPAAPQVRAHDLDLQLAEGRTRTFLGAVYQTLRSLRCFAVRSAMSEKHPVAPGTHTRRALRGAASCSIETASICGNLTVAGAPTIIRVARSTQNVGGATCVRTLG